MRNVNSRRGQTSITHLMNFALPPRPQDHRNNGLIRGTRRGNTFGVGSGHHSSDKARYIHANYRFVVKPYGDYKLQANNADQHLDWNDVLQILASSVSQDASCPICLSHPVAPRMAKCGHIFCLPCLIRYMHSTDDSNPLPEKKARWKKCPICWDTIFSLDTRAVRWYTGQESAAPREGDDLVLRLVMREPGSTLALPRDGADVLPRSESVPWYFAAEVMDYARIMKGSEDYMAEQYDGEIEDLRRQENEDELMFGEEPEWTRKAVNAVNESKVKLQGIGNPPEAAKKPAEKPRRQPIQFSSGVDNAPEMYVIQHASKSGHSMSKPLVVGSVEQTHAQSIPTREPKSISADSTPRQVRPSPSTGHNPDSPYFFYQALLHYYLAPLDIRILKAAFGDFASFPSTLLPRVERISTGHIMDDELRKRTKYLSHLPYGCEVGFVECNWTDVVVPEILDQFKEEIEKRRKRNRDKESREERDRVRAEKAEDSARWAFARGKRPDVPSESYSGDDFHPLTSTHFDAQNGSSFGLLASPSTSPSAPLTVWGTASVAPASPEMHGQADLDVDDGWLRFEAEIQAENELIAQVQAASMAESGHTIPNRPAGQGKKKKNKKITLMSTTARRAA